ncbi:2-dehydro-3-deoxy-6-phosphogalactonate aldolase [Salinisphaera sp. USBA-960]|uniref:2-dehydro-3-deoxy-6-phosphogalactonate aldolase n=1 Tax=Salinisphaera orenii TaxID=856731 RepID=UPI000DBE9122|nr:2-dehydro-3-deoxy-6-phosphogalactonate aldolase [Salifodinibacter halophilus]NNC25820.1 2-dehydro-3-deoxy-6-phosphogalactonate aldolase [Salifodinibacter halophilus]
MSPTPDIAEWLGTQLPLIAILRGIDPREVDDAGEILHTRGFRVIEVPLNSPQPYNSIARLARALGDEVLIGAGTVTTCIEVDAVAEAGGRLIVSPHFDPAVVERALARELIPLPGVFTTSELFAAYRAGARAVKLFPAEALTPASVKAMITVKPNDCELVPVGGVTPANITAYLAAGAKGAGLGGALYAPGIKTDQLAANADAFAAALETTKQ